MSDPKRGGITDSTIARIAGNIMAGVAAHIWVSDGDDADERAVRWSVRMAREIAAEVQRTQQATDAPQP